MRGAYVVGAALGLALPVVLWARGPDRSWTSAVRWSAQTSPTRGPPRAIGSTNAGCLEGAISLPAAGPGFELLHLGRHRTFGHPALVEYVRRLAAAASNKHLPPLLVGDLSQPRGGPTPTDHGSHQSGLDVDIAYTRPKDALVRLLDPAERETVTFTAVVDQETQTFTADWKPEIADLVELAAVDAAVDRVFVNPVVKRDICGRSPGAAWLAKIRPWLGHHDHFHVRLKCPEGSGACRPQAPLPPGDGCDQTLAWWFSRDARAAAEKRRGVTTAARGKRPKLPARCRQLLR